MPQGQNIHRHRHLAAEELCRGFGQRYLDIATPVHTFVNIYLTCTKKKARLCGGYETNRSVEDLTHRAVTVIVWLRYAGSLHSVFAALWQRAI